MLHVENMEAAPQHYTELAAFELKCGKDDRRCELQILVHSFKRQALH
jgi:hypothetical protein